MQHLKELLFNFQEQRRLDDLEGEAEHALTPNEILVLNKLLQDWAEFVPNGDRPVALVELRLRDKRNRQLALPERSAENTDSLKEDGDDDDDSEAEQDIGILNSFYLEDLERAIATVQEGNIPDALKQYLTPLSPEKRVDLYTDAGHRALLEMLHPRNLNHGRWSSEPHHAMGLMQQFAINRAAQIPESGGLFSVNGPPGTGKTTLLRDVISDTIVKRARILSILPSAGKAFQGKSKSISFQRGKPAHVSTLIPELTGFEMVVASSNNAAVENISRDLPKRGSVAQGSTIGYLQTVAHKIAAQTPKGSFTHLEDKEVPWGLISCVLGNARNRRQFADRFNFEAEDNKTAKLREDEKPFQTIWGWIKSYKGPSFAQAAKDFKKVDAALKARLERYVKLADLFAEIGHISLEDFCVDIARAIRDAKDDRQKAELTQSTVTTEINELEAQLLELKEHERLLDRTAPAWWHALLPTHTGRSYRASKAKNAREQIIITDHLVRFRRSLKAARSTFDEASQQLQQHKIQHAARVKLWHNKRDELAQLRQALGDPNIPAEPSDLEKDHFQIAGLWHSDDLAQQRTLLFESALRLQAAWLAEVGRSKGGFGGNIVAINRLLSSNLPMDRKMVAVLWQSFFMIVPVVSTTFASFARQFRGLAPGDLGWLFIDEAGQAVPQAAVGALLRARRAVIIGDPLQIEPVFTLPTTFIRTLAALSPFTSNEDYAPTRVSVQTLADQSNRFGTNMARDDEADLWIGSPLRVHRRCVDPMFSLANDIAYDGKMVFGLADRSSSDAIAPRFGSSAWIDIKGSATGKQNVPEQVNFIVDVLIASVRRDGNLPMIYIITPFKEIKYALITAIEQAVWISPDGQRIPRPIKLKTWMEERVGTVHTFQGKEENAVFMVLGTDATRQGATKWAASKPNLLNVAVTRARHRIFVVGDYDIWRTHPYFDTAATILLSISQSGFLTRIG
ncbi:DEAD/DEAH box helicase [Agrobacterium rosae]|uniref:DEAD/DEAH box helicase n=1 Tax=Agrobacterium rosae TaxID=1972867 RepID=UPI0031B80506